MRSLIPFYGNTEDDTHCFQAALRMALKHFSPLKEFSWKDLERISGKEEGKWTWPYAAMTWLSMRGYIVKSIELFDTDSFAKHGYDYLVSFFGQEVADIQRRHADILLEQRRARESLRYIQSEMRAPCLSDIESFLLKGFVVLCSVNSAALHGKLGYIGHTVVVLSIDEHGVVFHDPGLPPRPFAVASRELFERAWASPLPSSKNILAIKKRNIFYRATLFIAALPIRLYQKTLSYDHGPMKVFYPHGYCQFYPSCSEYGVRAIVKYGVVRGYLKAFWRVLRCHPWSAGGVDEP